MIYAADGKVVISTALDNSGVEKDTRKTVATLAAQYRKAGMSQSDAMKKAWAEVGHASGKATKKINRDIRSMGRATKEVKGELGGLTAVFGKLAAVVGVGMLARKMVQFGKESVAVASELKDALIGLQSVVEGQGRSFAQANKFVQEYISDGLVPAKNAITAYKNLALRGYSDDQIVKVMTALKDSAAFGRQSSYTLGEAVESATEGLKNENSILVDNAGVTKNVAKMWDEYARSIGTTANNLTQAQKIQAEVNGILEESKYQAGDAAKVAETYSGQVMQLQFNLTNLKVAVGNMLMPVLQALLPLINSIVAAFTRMANMAAAVTAAIFGKASITQKNTEVAASAGAGAKAEDKLAASTKKAGKAAKGALASFDQLNVLQHGGGGGASGPSADGAGGAAASTIGAEMAVEDTLSPQVQAIVDKVHQLLEPLRQINLEPLAAAFERLRQAIAPLTADIFAGLEWAYYNIFVPLATWTIEDVLPAFLDLLSGALGILTEVIEALQPLAQWLWDNFLQPIAEWTGGVIVDVLSALADVLDRIGAWIGEHQQVIETLVVILGGLITACGLVKGGLAATSLAMGVLSNAGLLASGVLAAVSTAFAFVNAHILIIVAVIGALIAAIVLLCKHWDTVKKVAVKVWDAIVDTIKGAVNGIIGFINGLIAGAAAGINGLIGLLNGLNFQIPDWGIFGEMAGKNFGFEIPTITPPQIPYLAQGAVLPANKPFLAMVGDQRNGTNVEAPLDTIKQALAEVMASSSDNREIVIRFAAANGLDQLVRLLKPYIDKESNRVGAKLISGGAF